MFCLYYDAASKSVKGLNGSGRAPEKLDLAYLRKQGITGTEIPLDNCQSAAPARPYHPSLRASDADLGSEPLAFSSEHSHSTRRLRWLVLCLQ